MTTLTPWKSRTPNETVNAPVSRMRWDWDRMFDRFLDDFWGGSMAASGLALPLDVTETDDEIVVRAEVPGIEPDHLDVSLTGDLLTLSGTKTDEGRPEQGNRSYSERAFGEYRRTLKLPCPVEMDEVSAEHRNGVVTITLHKAETVRPRRIQITKA